MIPINVTEIVVCVDVRYLTGNFKAKFKNV